MISLSLSLSSCSRTSRHPLQFKQPRTPSDSLIDQTSRNSHPPAVYHCILLQMKSKNNHVRVTATESRSRSPEFPVRSISLPRDIHTPLPTMPTPVPPLACPVARVLVFLLSCRPLLIRNVARKYHPPIVCPSACHVAIMTFYYPHRSNGFSRARPERRICVSATGGN